MFNIRLHVNNGQLIPRNRQTAKMCENGRDRNTVERPLQWPKRTGRQRVFYSVFTVYMYCSLPETCAVWWSGSRTVHTAWFYALNDCGGRVLSTNVLPSKTCTLTVHLRHVHVHAIIMYRGRCRTRVQSSRLEVLEHLRKKNQHVYSFVCCKTGKILRLLLPLSLVELFDLYSQSVQLNSRKPSWIIMCFFKPYFAKVLPQTGHGCLTVSIRLMWVSIMCFSSELYVTKHSSIQKYLVDILSRV